MEATFSFSVESLSINVLGNGEMKKEILGIATEPVHQTQTQTQVLRTQAVIPLCPAHFIAIVIMTEGKLGLQQLGHCCTYAPGNHV